MSRTLVIIQARMGSTRLPGKVMKQLHGKSVLEHDIERLKQCKEIDDIIIATTTNTEDDIIQDEALKCNVKYFRGSQEDVLSRYYYAAKENTGDIIVRITSDCPLIDPILLSDMIKMFKDSNYDIVSNAGSDSTTRTYPRGLDIEIFTIESLENAFHNAKESYQKEHVTPYIYENSNKIYYYKNTVDYSNYRWTLDTEEDWELICKIYDYLYHGKHDFYLDDIIELMRKHPELKDINSRVEQKKIK